MKSAAAGLPAGRWTCGGPGGRWLPKGCLPDGIAEPQSIPDIQYKQTSVEITTVTLWNDKSYDLTNNSLPLRAWRRQTSQQLDKVSEAEGPNTHCITQGLHPTYNCVQLYHIIYIYIHSYFMDICNRSFEIQQMINLITVHYRRTGAHAYVHAYCVTIMVLSLWRHSSGPWDNVVAIVVHSNALSRAMALTFKCLGSITI